MEVPCVQEGGDVWGVMTQGLETGGREELAKILNFPGNTRSWPWLTGQIVIPNMAPLSLWKTLLVSLNLFPILEEI